MGHEYVELRNSGLAIQAYRTAIGNIELLYEDHLCIDVLVWI
jgi:hypothetical protein